MTKEKSKTSQSQKPLISWLKDFYGWEKSANSLDSEDFVNINRSVLLVKFNPKTASDNLWISRNFSLFCQNNDGFSLYQCDSPSPIRKNIPLRFFYSKKYGKAFILNGQNKPLYEMFEFMLNNAEVKKSTIGSIESVLTNEHHFMQYSRLFFDNVAGRHGRFEIVETFKTNKNTYVGSYEQLQNRIDTHHRLLKNRNSEESDFLGEKLNNEFHQSLSSHLNERDKEIIKKGYSIKDATWINCYMIFKSTLFMADIEVDEKGAVVISNEKDLSHYDILNDSTKKSLLSEPKLIEALKNQGTIFPLK